MDRKRLAEIFEFDYTLEMYKPAASVAGATTRCRPCTANASWESSTPLPTGARVSCDSTRSTRTSLVSHPGAAVEAKIHDLARWLDLDVV